MTDDDLERRMRDMLGARADRIEDAHADLDGPALRRRSDGHVRTTRRTVAQSLVAAAAVLVIAVGTQLVGRDHHRPAQPQQPGASTARTDQPLSTTPTPATTPTSSTPSRVPRPARTPSTSPSSPRTPSVTPPPIPTRSAPRSTAPIRTTPSRSGTATGRSVVPTLRDVTPTLRASSAATPSAARPTK